MACDVPFDFNRRRLESIGSRTVLQNNFALRQLVLQRTDG